VREKDGQSVLAHPLLLPTGHELIEDDLHFHWGIEAYAIRGKAVSTSFQQVMTSWLNEKGFDGIVEEDSLHTCAPLAKSPN